MATNSTICKADLSVSDIDRGYYMQHALTMAQHPSETNQRLVLRLLAFAVHAGPNLTFGGGLNTDDEPDIWEKNLTGDIDVWVELGLPSEKRIRKACAQSKAVILYCYGDTGVAAWWQSIRRHVQRFKHLTIWQIPDNASQIMTEAAARNMSIQVTIQDREVTWYSAQTSIAFTCRKIF
jgi:uncharacterized protein YaeQ